MNNNTFEHDATPTWSGFIYQGEIAIYLAVKKICELRDEAKLDIKEIGSDYMLEVEKCEDISVIHKVNNKKEYISIHQVKNQKDTAIRNYRNPLIQLMLEKGFYKEKGLGSPNAYLHTSMNICGDNLNEINTNLNKWEGQIKEYYQKLSDLTKRIETENNDQTVLQEIKELVTNEPIKFERKAYKDPKNVITSLGTNKAKSNTEIKEAILQLKEYIENELCVSSVTKDVFIYQYEDDNKYYCDGTDVYRKLINLIKQYKRNSTSITEGQYEFLANKLLQSMRMHVSTRHRNSQNNKKYETTKPFKEFITILEGSLEYEEKEANILALKRIYDERLMQYCSIKCGNACSDSLVSCNLKDIESRITELMNEEFVQLCYAFNPNCDKAITNRECLNSLLSRDGLNGSVFKVLKSLPNHTFKNIDRCTKLVLNNDNKNAFLTAISSDNDDIEFVIQDIVKAIENNMALVSPIFDTDQLITSRLDAKKSVWDSSFSTIEDKYMNQQENSIEDNNSHSICTPKKPEFIKADHLINNITKPSN